MQSVVMAVVVYVVILVLFRLSGKRTLAEVSPFDLVLLLLISEAVQQAMVGQDDSVTHAVLLVITLIGLNVIMSEIKVRFRRAEHVLDSTPLLIVENGKPIEAHMKKERVDVGDVLDTAREVHGIHDLEQIRYAILERNGKISIIPAEPR